MAISYKSINKFVLLFAIASLPIIFSSCAFELAVEGLAVDDGLIMTAGDQGFARAATASFAEGRIIASNEASFNTFLERIKLVRQPGQAAGLLIEGQEKPFAFVEANEGKIRLANYAREFAIDRNVFAVQNNNVMVRANASIKTNNVVTKIHKGDLVVKLVEDNGWYQVRVVQRGKVFYGFVDPKYLIALIAINDKAYTPGYHACSFCNGTGKLFGPIQCFTCNGSGYANCSLCNGVGHTTCSSCHGNRQFVCSNCGGKKQFVCGNCHGDRQFVCSNCNGKGSTQCSDCKGAGSIMTSGGLQKCATCYSTGHIPCYTCNQSGVIPCYTCNQTGVIPCYTCNESGYTPCYTCNQSGILPCYTCNQTGKASCIYCRGTGTMTINYTCTHCNGAGLISN